MLTHCLFFMFLSLYSDLSRRHGAVEMNAPANNAPKRSNMPFHHPAIKTNLAGNVLHARWRTVAAYHHRTTLFHAIYSRVALFAARRVRAGDIVQVGGVFVVRGWGRNARWHSGQLGIVIHRPFNHGNEKMNLIWRGGSGRCYRGGNGGREQ